MSPQIDMKFTLINKIFNTPIGKVSCDLESNTSTIKLKSKRHFQNGLSEIYRTNCYEIELIEFKIKMPLVNGENVTDSVGWIWKIIKRNNENEQIQLSCKLKEHSKDILFDIATGEHLDAIEASDDKWIINIGTEDGYIMHARAKNNDWMPIRFANNLLKADFLYGLHKQGFEKRIPLLIQGEKLYIHFLVAYDRKDNQSVNTWIAVDEHKDILEKWIVNEKK